MITPDFTTKGVDNLPGKDVYYLKHDSNARNDPRLLALRSVYKWEGIGIYWALCEILREQSDFVHPLDFETLAMQLLCKRSKVEKFISDCVHKFINREGRGLFESDGVSFWSKRLKDDAIKFQEVREVRRKAALTKHANAKQ